MGTRARRVRLNASRWLLFSLALVLAMAGTLAIVAVWWPESDDAPTETTEAGMAIVSEQGHFHVTAIPQLDPVVINELHTWTLHVESSEGDPVDNAVITVDGDMPAHGHGMPTRPQVTEALGNGRFLVEGMKFQMGGAWVIDITISAGGVTDTAHLDLMLG